jgi:uncharacterized protein involved in type VI secretion and phage assembly
MVDGANGDGVWARVSNIMATDKHGSWFYPEVNDEVICGALGGDMRFPVILGHLYSKKLPAPESEFSHSEKNHEKGWFTREELLFHFNDEDKIIRVETPGGRKFRLDDKLGSITLEDKKSKFVIDSNGFKFDGPYDFVVDVKGKVDIKALGNISAKTMAGNFDAQGNAATIKGTISATLDGGTANVKGMGMATVKAGMVMIN